MLVLITRRFSEGSLTSEDNFLPLFDEGTSRADGRRFWRSSLGAKPISFASDLKCLDLIKTFIFHFKIFTLKKINLHEYVCISCYYVMLRKPSCI